MDERTERVRERLRGVADPIALLEGIFAHAPMALQIYDPSGKSILTNRAFIELFGAEPPPGYNVLADELAIANGVAALIERAFRGETIRLPPTWYDPRALRHVEVVDGNRVAIETTFFPLWDHAGALGHVAVVFKDLTAELTARAQAEAERDLLSLIIEQCGDGIIVANAEGVIEVFNPAAAHQHGREKQAIAAPHWGRTYDLGTEDGHPLPLERTPLYRALHGEKVEDARWTVRRPDGTVRTLTGTATPLARGDGSPAGAVLIARDETERLAREQERAELHERERQVRGEAERACRAKDEFLAMLGHELRNPLAPIVTALDLIELRDDAPPTRELQVIRRQVDHLSRLVDDLLDVSRIARGKIELRRRAVSIQSVVDVAVEMASPLFENRNQHLAIEVEPGLFVDGDEARLAQVISNLLTNAARYTPERGHISLIANRRDGDVAIEVRDSGIGIDPALLDRVFDMFFQGGAPIEVGGLGLGLTLVKSLVELHGGHVTAHSDGPGRGSTFSVQLPARPADRQSAPKLVDAAWGARKRILVVDDNVDAAELLGATFAAAGHDVRVAHDGPSALATLDQFTPEVAVLDLGLPVMDGYELAGVLHDRVGESLVLVALSGYGQPEDRARTAAAGFRQHLVKPAPQRSLLAAVQLAP